MAAGKDLRQIANNYRQLQHYVDSQTKLNVKHACYEMVAKAKERTPPHEGEERGKNTVTGNMARHWDSNHSFNNNGTIRITLFNNVQYASYVENGHKMTKHFVPWLYIDGTGTLARHEPVAAKRRGIFSWLFNVFFKRKQPNPGEPLFGLVVGTKTQYIPPEHIVDQSKERFFQAYTYMRSGMIKRINGQIEE